MITIISYLLSLTVFFFLTLTAYLGLLKVKLV